MTDNINKELTVIDKPTHTTAPNTVVHLDIDELEENNLTYLPRNFSDVYTVIRLKDYCDEELPRRRDLDTRFSEGTGFYVRLAKFGSAIFAPIIAGYATNALASHIFDINTDS